MIRKWILKIINKRLDQFVCEEFDSHVYGAISRRDWKIQREKELQDG